MNNSSSKIEINDAFVQQWTPMVWKLAKSLSGIGRKYGLSYDDLAQTGMVGLLKAAREFDGRGGCTFCTFAYSMVRWAIIGDIRSASPYPRELRRWLARWNSAADDLASRLGRTPGTDEMAVELGITISECHESLTAINTIYADPVRIPDIPGFPEVMAAPGGRDALTYAIYDEQERAINRWLDDQPARNREIVKMRYQIGMEVWEIAAALGVSKTRVDQVLFGSSNAPNGILNDMRADLNPTAEEVAEKKRQQERASRVTNGTHRQRTRLREQKSASYRKKAGFYKPTSGDTIEFLADSANLMVRAGVKYSVTVLSSGKFRITDERGWHTTESMARLRTAKFRPVAA